jgi:hypothetical protein
MRGLREIDIGRLRDVLDYNPGTGLFHWRVQLSLRGPVGAQAGCISRQSGREYIKVRFDGALHQGHRLAWAHYYGEQPPPKIDHEDGDGCHNWIANLREANQSQNSANMRKTIKSSTGLRGVYPYGTSGLLFEAKAMKDGEVVRFGVFDAKDVAYAAYCDGMKSLFGEFASLV